MATTKIAVPSHLVQFQQLIPRSFIEALKQGWRLVAETSIEKRGKRSGLVTLEKNGQRLSVTYSATRGHYRFGSVKVL